MRRISPRGRFLPALLAAAVVFTACSGEDTVDRLRVNLSLPEGWEDRLDMEALSAVSSTPYVGTLRLTFDCDGLAITREAPWDAHVLSLEDGRVDSGCGLLLEGLTAGRAIFQARLAVLPPPGGGESTVQLLLREADGFSVYGSLIYPRQDPSVFVDGDGLLLLGGSADTGTIERMDLSGGAASAYACSLAYPRTGQTALLDQTGERIFVFGGSDAVDDNVFEVVNKINISSYTYSFTNVRNDFYPVIYGNKLILLNGYDQNGTWFINSLILDTNLSMPPTVEAIGILNENIEAKSLQNGKYLALVGGMSGINYLNEVNFFLLDTYSTRTQKFLSSNKKNFSVANLGNGVFILAGGFGSDGYLSDIQEIDVINGTVDITVQNLVLPRSRHSSTVLKDGKILIIGGLGLGNTAYSSEIYDPTTGISHLLPWRLRYPRVGHAAVLLPDGRVAVIGGNMATGVAEVFNPVVEN